MGKKAQIPPKSFEEALAELERILADIEDGQVGLEQSIVSYERGTFLIQHCRGVLSNAEKQISLLTPSSQGGIDAEALPNDPPADPPA